MKINKISFLTLFLMLIMISCNRSIQDSGANNSLEENKKVEKIDESIDSGEVDTTNIDYEKYITPEKKLKIVKLKKEIGLQFKAIGMNPDLSGYEKGIQKRNLKLKFQKEINDIINEGIPYKEHYKGDIEPFLESKEVQEVDLKLEELEHKYKTEKDKLESQEDHINKSDYKIKKDELKSQYKQQKELLKIKKDSIIYNELYK